MATKHRMTKEWLRKRCKETDLYRTPGLNDKLYLNFQGFSKIECLEEYTGLRSIFLEGNILEDLEGLAECRELKCLFVQQNSLRKISHLETLVDLSHINVSNNRLQTLENLSCLTKLDTLLAAHNKFKTVDSVRHLVECPSITVLDLQRNEIDDVDVLDVLKQMPNLSCLYLQGNPVVSKIKNYRKTLIASLPNLRYLDDRPVFENDRRCAEAFISGGVQAERDERTKIREEEDAKRQRNFEYMRKIREEGWRKRRIALGLDPNKKGDPFFDELDTDSELEDLDIPEEPPELTSAREKLALFSARAGEAEPKELTEDRHRIAANGGEVKVAEWAPLEERREEEGTEREGEEESEESKENVRAAVNEALEKLAKEFVAEKPAGEKERERDAALASDAALGKADVSEDPSGGKENVAVEKGEKGEGMGGGRQKREKGEQGRQEASFKGGEGFIAMKGQHVVDIVYSGGSDEEGEPMSPQDALRSFPIDFDDFDLNAMD